MTFRDEIKKTIPERLHVEPDFKALHDMVALNNIKSKDELTAYLDREIKAIEEWLKKNQSAGGTMVKVLRDKIIKLDCLKNCKGMCDEFL